MFLAQVSLASEFLWNWNSREANAAFGYDYILRQCRLRGRIDTDGKVCLRTATKLELTRLPPLPVTRPCT
jgi:mitochondrial import receptor subunit TOM40